MTTLKERIAQVLELPPHHRPAALESALLADDGVEELFALEADLARILASWA